MGKRQSVCKYEQILEGISVGTPIAWPGLLCIVCTHCMCMAETAALSVSRILQTRTTPATKER